MTDTTTSLARTDAHELAELLDFLRDWLAGDHDPLSQSLARFVGNTAYDITGLRTDLARFAFLLGGTDGDDLFQPDTH